MRNVRPIGIACVALIGFLMHSLAIAVPPQILQIYREPLKPASEAAYGAIEVETARIAAELACPHPYLGAESLGSTKEVWWFNGYDSAAAQKQVFEAYAKNTQLMAAFQQLSARKKNLTLTPIETFANYRPDLSTSDPWTWGHGRFLVVTTTRGKTLPPGTVFEASDGMLYIVRSARSRDEAQRIRDVAGSDAFVLAVRPTWSFPAKDWIAADPAFWESR